MFEDQHAGGEGERRGVCTQDCGPAGGGLLNVDDMSDVLCQLEWPRAERLVGYHRLCLVKTASDTRLPADIAALFSSVTTPYQT